MDQYENGSEGAVFQCQGFPAELSLVILLFTSEAFCFKRRALIGKVAQPHFSNMHHKSDKPFQRPIF